MAAIATRDTRTKARAVQILTRRVVSDAGSNITDPSAPRKTPTDRRPTALAEIRRLKRKL
jgi:hypothetical protein